MSLTRQQLEEQEELKRYPDQRITWAYEEEVKPVKVLIDIEAGVRTNKIINCFHLPESKIKEWESKTRNIRVDAAKTMLGQETSVGFPVGQQHVAELLQNECSQQHILCLAASHIISGAHKIADQIHDQHSGGHDGLLDFLSQIMGQNGDQNKG